MRLKTKAVELPPPPEQNVHSSIMSNARRLWLAGFRQERAFHHLSQWRNQSTFRKGRTVSDKELEDAIRTAWSSGPNKELFARTRNVPTQIQRWPEPNPAKRAAIIDPWFHVVTLWENSPWQTSGGKLATRYFLEQLFPGNPLLCCGWNTEVFNTLPLSEWKHPERMQFLTPSPMTSRTGARQDGNGESAHTLSNTGPRRFLVADFDDRAGLDTHAGAAWYLGTLLPLVMVLWTGGKGLHAWFKTWGLSDEELTPFFRLAVEFGADPRLWTRSQFARIPDGSRDDGGAGTVQRVYYFNPEVLV
jgi:hypothetical protein